MPGIPVFLQRSLFSILHRVARPSCKTQGQLLDPPCGINKRAVQTCPRSMSGLRYLILTQDNDGLDEDQAVRYKIMPPLVPRYLFFIRCIVSQLTLPRWALCIKSLSSAKLKHDIYPLIMGRYVVVFTLHIRRRNYLNVGVRSYPRL